MASFTIKFIANTTGLHTVYYRNYEDPINTYPNSASVNVTAPGLQGIEIDISGSLYCAPNDITYTGYVIADCMAPTPTTNGIPDSVLANGTTWTVVMEEQTDPCQNTTITCDNVPVDSVNITGAGSYYGGAAGNAGAAMTVTFSAPEAPGGVTATATANQGDGVLTSIGITSTGSGYVNGTYLAVPLIEVGQVATHGAAATADITVTGGIVTSVGINAGGSAYTTSDQFAPLTIDETFTAITGDGAALTGTLNGIVGGGYVAGVFPTIGGSGTGLTLNLTTSFGDVDTATIFAAGSGYLPGEVVNIDGGNGAETYTIDTVATAAVTEAEFSVDASGYFADQLDIDSFVLTDPGSGYQAVPTIDFGLTEGFQVIYTVVTEACPVLTLSDHDCGTVVNVIGTPAYVLELNDSVTLCADATTLSGLDAQFTEVDNGNCHCLGCENVTINLSGLTGTGQISYQTCWDSSNGLYGSFVLVTNTITGGAANVDLGCIIPETLVIDQGTLDALPGTILAACV